VLVTIVKSFMVQAPVDEVLPKLREENVVDSTQLRELVSFINLFKGSRQFGVNLVPFCSKLYRFINRTDKPI